MINHDVRSFSASVITHSRQCAPPGRSTHGVLLEMTNY